MLEAVGVGVVEAPWLPDDPDGDGARKGIWARRCSRLTEDKTSNDPLTPPEYTTAAANAAPVIARMSSQMRNGGTPLGLCAGGTGPDVGWFVLAAASDMETPS